VGIPTDIPVLVVDLFLSGVATFFAIMLWSLTREPAWMLIVIGIILRFGDVVFQTLDRFGIIAVADVQLLGVPVFWVVLRAVPWLFFIAGISAMIRALRM
jgi:hypothetical protein